MVTGDFADFTSSFPVEEVVIGFTVDCGVMVVVVGFVASLVAVVSFFSSFAPLVSFTGSLVSGFGAGVTVFSAVPSRAGSGVFTSSFFTIGAVGVCATFTSLTGDVAVFSSAFACGDSTIGWSLRKVFGVLVSLSNFSNGFEISFPAVGVVISLDPPLSFRIPGTESWLPSRVKPILPSFSIAMKLVRTLASGRGDSAPETVTMTTELAMFTS